MKRGLVPYNVMRHAEWETAPRMPGVIAGSIVAAFGGAAVVGSVGTFLIGAVSYLAVTAVTSWALSALTPKPDFGNFSNASSGVLVNRRAGISPKEFVYGKVRKGGIVTFDESTGGENKILHRVITMAGHEVADIGTVYINDQPVTIDSQGYVTSSPWNSKIRILKHLGNQTSEADGFANVPGESIQSTLRSETAVLGAENNFIGKNTAFIYARLEYDQDVFANGVPLITAEVSGKKVFDPRDGTTAFSDNAALCIRDYITASYGLSDPEIDEQSFQIAANICDESIPLAGGDSENRYSINGIIKANESYGEVLQKMVTACAGTLFWGMGAWKLVAGAYINPSKSFTLDDLRGSIRVQPQMNTRDTFNAVRGVFNDASEDYITVDYPEITSSVFQAEDGGEQIPLDLPLPFTTSAASAQRLAKLTLLRSREQIAMDADFSLKAFDVQVGETITFTNERYGWDEKQFEVVGWNLKATEEGTIVVRLSLRETSAEAFQWDAEESEIISNNTNLPDITANLGIANLTVSGGGRTQGDGTFVNTAILQWDEAANAFVEQYEVQWKPVADSTYSTTFTTENSIELAPLIDGIEYDFRVRSITARGNRGLFSSANFTGGGDVTAPGPVTDLAAVGAYQTITISYTPPTDADWSRVNIYESADSNFANAALIGSSTAEVFYRLNLPNDIERFYWAETVDFTGNTGTIVGPVSATTQLIEENDFSQSLQDTLEQAGVQAVNTLPASGDFDNQIVLLLSDFKLYRWDEAAGQWSDTLFTAIEDNSVTSQSVIANAIVTSKLAAGAVTAEKMNVNELSAVAASIGTFQSALSGERVRITDDVIEVYDSSGQIRVKIGNLNA